MHRAAWLRRYPHRFISRRNHWACDRHGKLAALAKNTDSSALATDPAGRREAAPGSDVWMISAGRPRYFSCDSNAAIPRAFAGISQYLAARSNARNAAWRRLGDWSARTWRTAKTFSVPLFQIACDVATAWPSPARAATSPHGAPAQNPSILSAAIASTVWAGGTTVKVTSRSGSIPAVASQYRSNKLC